jgi:RND family efflux transporter MFP subunit
MIDLLSFVSLPRTRLYSFLMILAIGVAVFSAGCGIDSSGTSSEEGPHDDHAHDEHAGHDDSQGAEPLTLSAESLSSLRVETVDVVEASIGATRQFPGRVVPIPDQESMVTSLLTGRIERVFVNEGDRVRRGQPVAVVNGPMLGDLVAELRHTYIDLKRQQRLRDRDVGIEKNLLAAQTAHAAARQHLRALGLSSEEVSTLARQTEDAEGVRLRAPTSGVVLERRATQGGPVKPGDVLLHVANLSPIWVEADVYEDDLPLLSEGMDVTVHSSRGNDAEHTGRLLQILPDIDKQRRVATARIQVENEGRSLRPGMYASVRVDTGGEMQPALPTEAIMTDGTESYVIVAENDSTFRRIAVSAAADGAGRVAVPELELGTRVVTIGAFQIASTMSGVEAGHSH